MFLRSPEPVAQPAIDATDVALKKPAASQFPVLLAVALSTAATLFFGIIFPATEHLRSQTLKAAQVNIRPIAPSASAQP
jgi:hypothetical protein